MRYRFLFNFLKLAAGSKGIKKINLFLNFAIFLSVFAITSTLISIYYESKITSLERKITKNEITLDILSVSTLAIPGKVLSLENIADDIKKNNDVINYFYFTKVGSIYDDYERYYRPVMSIAEYLNAGIKKIIEDRINKIFLSTFLNLIFNATNNKNGMKDDTII